MWIFWPVRSQSACRFFRYGGVSATQGRTLIAFLLFRDVTNIVASRYRKYINILIYILILYIVSISFYTRILAFLSNYFYIFASGGLYLALINLIGFNIFIYKSMVLRYNAVNLGLLYTILKLVIKIREKTYKVLLTYNNTITEIYNRLIYYLYYLLTIVGRISFFFSSLFFYIYTIASGYIYVILSFLI